MSDQHDFSIGSSTKDFKQRKILNTSSLLALKNQLRVHLVNHILVVIDEWIFRLFEGYLDWVSFVWHFGISTYLLPIFEDQRHIDLGRFMIDVDVVTVPHFSLLN